MANDPLNETQPVSSQPEEPDLSSTQPHRPEPDPNAETQAVYIDSQPAEATSPVAVEPSHQSVPPAGGSRPPAPPDAGVLEAEPRKPKRSLRWLLYAFLGLLLLGSIGAVSAYGGYLSAIDLRLGNQSTQVAGEAQHQFDLGMADLEAKRYDLARQRFEYVIQLDPTFPGVTEVLAQALLAINTTATPTIAPTPTLSPTPDTRGQDELYLQAREYMAGGDWTAAIDTLLTLRKRYPAFQTVEVDGLLYVALRNRGVQKISVLADLEGGTYDLSLAGSFGPLDVEARNWRDWATLYVRGASFWDVDWEQAVFYFSQLAQIAPNLMDASRLTAFERYYLSLVGYADWLTRQELWCEAEEQYELAANLRADPAVQPTAQYAFEQCANPTRENTGGIATLTPTLSPTPGGLETLTPTPTGATPTATATQSGPPASTPTPTQTQAPATATNTQPAPPTVTPTPTTESSGG